MLDAFWSRTVKLILPLAPRAVKRCAIRIARLRTLNAVLVAVARFLTPVLPNAVLMRIPVAGRVCLRLPDAKKLYFENDGNDFIATALCWRGIGGFEASTIRLFLELLEQSDTVLDIGANTGLYALIAAVHDDRRKVYGFEPVPRIRDYFEANIDSNGLQNIEIVSAAATNYDGEIQLYVPGSDSIPTAASTLQGFRQASEVLSVRAVSIDSFVAANNIPRVDLMKIDTEATEHVVLEGARNTIKRDAPAIICEVLKGRTEEQLHAVMDDLGYQYFWISDEGLVEQQRIVGHQGSDDLNYLFLPKGRAEAALQDRKGA